MGDDRQNRPEIKLLPRVIDYVICGSDTIGIGLLMDCDANRAFRMSFAVFVVVKNPHQRGK